MNIPQPIDEFETSPEPVREQFVIDDDSKADWAMRKLASIRRKQAENEAIFSRELDRIQEWLLAVNNALEADAQWFESNLKPYALQQRSEGRKSVVLPHGTVKTTAGRPKVEVINEDELLKWATDSEPSVIRVKTEIDKKALNALITESGDVISTQGEIVPAVRVIEPTVNVSFDIK